MWATILIILNLFILEVSLSLDNISVLALMVKDLPPKDSQRALRWGMWGAYLMRGACLLCAGYLVNMWPLKIAGGLYLIYLTYGHFSKADDTIQEDVVRKDSKLYLWLGAHTKLSRLWMTIILVEFLDLSFSVDNIFAAIALSSNIWIILFGVFLGIAAMRVLAGWFVTLIDKYPSLEKSAYVVIGILGGRLLGQGVWGAFKMPHVQDKVQDLIFSLILMLIFFIPMLNAKPKVPQSPPQ